MRQPVDRAVESTELGHTNQYIGKYEVLKRITKGGMGEIYVVRSRQVGETLVLKSFRMDLFAAHTQFAERFRREALAWINLDVHANITRALLVETIAERPFLVLEYVRGGDLSRWIGSARLREDLPKVLRLGLQFCAGMNHALSRSITAHRDIKPQNCLLTETGTLKITDFGLAKLFDDFTAGGNENTASPGVLVPDATSTGEGAGTLTHMPPEQFDDVKRVDVRGDIYSFGVMLFQMVTGQLPFQADSRQGYARIHKLVPPPKLTRCPEALNSILQTCLAKNPADRLADFHVLGEQLAALLQQLTGQAFAGGPTQRPLNPRQLLNKAASLARLGQPRQALALFDQCLSQAGCGDAGLVSALCLQAWEGKGQALLELGQPESALECYQSILKHRPDDARIWYRKGLAFKELTRYQDAIQCFEQAQRLGQTEAEGQLEQCRSSLGAPAAPTRESPSLPEDELLQKASAAASGGNFSDALGLVDEILARNPDNLEAWQIKGIGLGHLGRLEEGLGCLEEALKINPEIAKSWHYQAALLAHQGRAEAALRAIDQALRLDPQRGAGWTLKGEILASAGRGKDAQQCYDQACQLAPADAEPWKAKANLLVTANQLAEALACYERALELAPTDQHLKVRIALLLLQLSRFSDLARFDHDLAQLVPSDAQEWFAKGICLFRLRRYAESLAALDEATKLTPLSGHAWLAKGSALAALERLHEALPCFIEAARLGQPEATRYAQRVRQRLQTLLRPASRFPRTKPTVPRTRQ
jgi:tetratricopeptide (TPR) repeat protein